MREMLKLLSLLVLTIILVTACDSGGDDLIDLPQRLTTPNDNARISFPEGWVGRGLSNAMVFSNVNETPPALPVSVGAGEVYAKLEVHQSASFDSCPPQPTLEQVLACLVDPSVTLGNTQRFNEEDLPSVIATGTVPLSGTTVGIIYAVTYEDSSYGVLYVMAPEDEIDDYETIARSMIVTFDTDAPPEN